MLGVDTPDLKRPDREKALAATAFTEAWLAKGNFTIETCGRYHLGRLLAKPVALGPGTTIFTILLGLMSKN